MKSIDHNFTVFTNKYILSNFRGFNEREGNKVGRINLDLIMTQTSEELISIVLVDIKAHTNCDRVALSTVSRRVWS